MNGDPGSFLLHLLAGGMDYREHTNIPGIKQPVSALPTSVHLMEGMMSAVAREWGMPSAASHRCHPDLSLSF